MQLNRVSLRARLVITLVLLAAAGLVTSGFVVNHQLESYLIQRVDRQLVGGSGAVLNRLQGTTGTVNSDRGPGPAGGPSPFPSGTYGAIYTTTGKLITQTQFDFSSTTRLRDDDDKPSAKLTPDIPSSLVTEAAQHGPTFTTVPSGSDDLSYRVMLAPNNNHVLAIGIPLTDIDATLTQLLWLELGVGLGALIVLGGLAYLIVRTELRPLERMSATASEIAASDLTEVDLRQRVDAHSGGTEVSQLGTALNTMLAEIESSIAAREAAAVRLRQFIADASHELRTPLTSIRGYAEMFERGAVDEPADLATAMRRIEQESARMSALVEDLLLLARLDQQRVLQSEPVDVSPMLRDAALDAQAVFPDHLVTVSADTPVVVLGDDPALRQVIVNLVRNACTHTPPGTAVEISASADGTSGIVTVTDHGPGIPLAFRDEVFERFTRADSSRVLNSGGTGLGLSIVAAIVNGLSGSVTLSETAGGGATMTVRIPLA